MDQLEALRVLIAVCEAGSLSAGARALGLPVPTVSRRLQALETHVGTRLLSRTTRRMAVTEAGRNYLETARSVVAEVAAADRRARGEDVDLAGRLTVTAPVAFGRLHVVPVVVAYLRENAALDLRLRLADRVVELIDEGVDVAVRIASLPDSSLVALRAGSVRLLTCASPAYLRERGTPATPHALAGHDCITVSGFASADHWSYHARGRTRTVPVRSRLVVSTAESAVDAAIAGLGITRALSYQTAAALAKGELRTILAGYEPPAVPIQLVHGEGRRPRARVQRFLRFAAPRLRASLKTP